MKKNSFFLFLFVMFFSCENKNTEGERLYNNHCLNCHQDGKGVAKLIPPISKEFLIQNKTNLACMIKYGIEDSLLVNGIWYNTPMPNNDRLSDIDIVNLLNYLNEKFGTGEKEIYNIKNVKENLSECKSR